MFTLQEIKEKLKDRKLSIVAAEIGMSRQQLWEIYSGNNNNPTQRTLEKISDYLQKNP